MATITTAATASLFSALVTRVRTALGDPATDTDNQRFTNDEIRQALDDEIAQMWNELTESPDGFLESVTLAYAADSETVPLPAGFEAQNIYKVELYDDPGAPVFLDYVAQLDAGQDLYRSGWFLQGNEIGLLPAREDAATLRIHRVKNFPRTTAAAASDNHALPVNHEELMVLGAACRLGEIDDEGAERRYARMNELRQLFRNSAARMRGPNYVRDVRKYR